MSDMNEAWRERVENMRVGHSGGAPAVHKPLLTLLILARAARGGENEFPYEEVAPVLKKALKRFGAEVTRVSPEYPFWHLRSEGFWLIPDLEGVADGGPTMIKRQQPVGRVREEDWEGLREGGELIEQLVVMLLDRFWGEEQHDSIRAFFGLERAMSAPNALSRVTLEFSRALRDAGVRFGEAPRHTDFVRTFVTSLATKRFVILTGLSGSGKTQIALRFGDWLGAEHRALVPVRPDWTGAEALFGYEDALSEPRGGRRGWAVPTALEFMLRAASDETHPYLLILDEMNLAHVERYFADALSGMESGEPVLPNLEREDDGVWRLREGEDATIPLPSNLFVVGTVNIDETTYMFSPKVLDRANTIEFRVRTEDLFAAPSPPSRTARGDADLARQLLEASRQRATPAAPELFEQYMRQLHALLSEAGFEFGHRVFHEALRFASLFAAAGEPDVLRALDRQVMQKLLPRLHGSRRRLEPTLCALARFCHALEVEPGAILDGSATAFDPLARRDELARLPISFDKLQRMTRNLRANQFTSFTE